MYSLISMMNFSLLCAMALPYPTTEVVLWSLRAGVHHELFGQ